LTDTDALTKNLIELSWGVIWKTGGASALPATGNRRQSSIARTAHRANHDIRRETCCIMTYPDCCEAADARLEKRRKTLDQGPTA
jgi:hypothetical protein